MKPVVLALLLAGLVHAQPSALEAMTASNIDRLWPEGSGVYSLTGNGVVVALTEPVQCRHREFGAYGVLSRRARPRIIVSNPETCTDGFSAAQVIHGTGVAGRIGAVGVEPAAVGVAPLVTLHPSIRLAAAAAHGALVVNNSTTSPAGRDDEAVAHPHLAVVQAAGNACSGACAGEYGNLAWAGQLKHVITVGAILGFPAGRYAGATSVVSTSTSSWGPAFDGRIKPDLVAVSRSADGAGLRTPTGPESDAYGHISGTSAAAPVVTGGLALLVEHARRRLDIGTFRASTWKALLLHTAREAGPHGGPDYRFGYGLFDASAAVRVIDEVAEGQGMIRAVELADGDTLWLDVDGGPIVRATGAWTDPYASTFDLVHDMDLRIVDADGTEHLPWTLNPQEPTAPALKADNSRDVVEQVIVENGVPPYRLRITHKGRLRSPQWISLVVSSPSRPAKNKRSLQQK